MPIQLGGPSLSKPKKAKKVLDPFGVPHVGMQALPPLAGAKPIGLPTVAIPSAASIAGPGLGGGVPGAGASTDPYGDELRGDPMYSIGQKNYQDALAMGERTMLSDPINRLIQSYGYDPRSTTGLPSNLASLATKYLDQPGLDAARAGGYTTAQQIERGFGQALAGIPTNLAERGLQHSGSSAIIGNRLNYERGLSDKTAIDQLLSGIGTANQNWTDFQTGQANVWRQAQEDIATRRAQQQGYHGETDPSTLDYSGGSASTFQPDDATGALMERDQGAGQWDSWASAMGQNINAANKPTVFKPAPATAKLIKKMRSSGQMSAWERAMQNLGG